MYAIGDVNGVGTPKAGVFGEGAARAVAGSILAQLGNGPAAEDSGGLHGSCYLEFGNEMVARVDVEFLPPALTRQGAYQEPYMRRWCEEKNQFGASRFKRWSGSNERVVDKSGTAYGELTTQDSLHRRLPCPQCSAPFIFLHPPLSHIR